MKKIPASCEPSERSALEEIMSEPLERHFARRAMFGADLNHLEGTMELALSPQGPMAKVRELMATPEGNREVISTLVDKWIGQHIALDLLYESEIMEKSSCDDNIYDIEKIYEHQRTNQNSILKLFTAKKSLLTLPGISFTQVNMTQEAQQINNNFDGNEKIEGQI